MSELKVGDRVRVTNGEAADDEYSAQVETGWIGTVKEHSGRDIYSDSPYRVIFDEDPCRDAYGWWMHLDHMELIGPASGPDPVEKLKQWAEVDWPRMVTEVTEHLDVAGYAPRLDPTDPFESVLISMVETNRKKRADYAVDGSPWSNFEFTASVLDIQPQDAAIHNVAQKLARLTSLRANGRTEETANEAVTDTYLDLAVYAVIALAIVTHPTGKVE